MTAFLAMPDLTAALPSIAFYALAAFTVAGAIAAAVAPRIVQAGFSLIAAFLGVAGLYALLGADFVAFSQIIVYIGGILVLLVFGILLTDRTELTLGLEKSHHRGTAIVIGGVVLLGLLLTIGATDWNAIENPGDPTPTTSLLGRAFMDPDGFLVPFELSSVLLLAALVGAAYLVRRRRDS
jgi:NAD(P)H-quinone oxidoreductase subunit 6